MLQGLCLGQSSQLEFSLWMFSEHECRQMLLARPSCPHFPPCKTSRGPLACQGFGGEPVKPHSASHCPHPRKNECLYQQMLVQICHGYIMAMLQCKYKFTMAKWTRIYLRNGTFRPRPNPVQADTVHAS